MQLLVAGQMQSRHVCFGAGACKWRNSWREPIGRGCCKVACKLLGLGVTCPCGCLARTCWRTCAMATLVGLALPVISRQGWKFSFSVSCPALPCPALPCPALPCPALPCPALRCPALPHPAKPRPAPPHPVLRCPAPPHPVLPCPALPSPNAAGKLKVIAL